MSYVKYLKTALQPDLSMVAQHVSNVDAAQIDNFITGILDDAMNINDLYESTTEFRTRMNVYITSLRKHENRLSKIGNVLTQLESFITPTTVSLISQRSITFMRKSITENISAINGLIARLHNRMEE